MKEKAKKKRKEIILSIFSKLSSVDLNKATVNAICDAAEISVGTFYHYFEDKADFFNQVFVLTDEYLMEEILPTLTHENELENLIQFYDGFAQYAKLIGSNILKSIYTSYTSFMEESRETRPLYTIPCEILKKAKKKEQISQGLDEKELAKNLVIIVRGYVYDWTRYDGSYDLREYIFAFIKLHLKALKP